MTATTESHADRLEKLEREHRNLVSRLERLEKRKRGAAFAGLVGNVLLLVVAGLIGDYLGLLGPYVQRLPLKARTVEADEFVLRDEEGKPALKLSTLKHQPMMMRFSGEEQPKSEPLFPGTGEPSGPAN